MIGLSVAKASKNPSLFLNGSSESTEQCSLPFGKGSSGSENLPGLNSDKIEIKSFPFLASYGYYAKPKHETWNHICTASILSKRALLTAAHCLRLLEELVPVCHLNWVGNLGHWVIEPMTFQLARCCLDDLDHSASQKKKMPLCHVSKLHRVLS